jgi:hypothetical protein
VCIHNTGFQKNSNNELVKFFFLPCMSLLMNRLLLLVVSVTRACFRCNQMESKKGIGSVTWRICYDTIRPCFEYSEIQIFKEFCGGCIARSDDDTILVLHPFRRIPLTQQEIEAFLSLKSCKKCNNSFAEKDSRLGNLIASTENG